jgi:hypothetical protein
MIKACILHMSEWKAEKSLSLQQHSQTAALISLIFKHLDVRQIPTHYTIRSLVICSQMHTY